MMTSSEIWVAFARTFSMLFLVLGVLIFLFYLTRKLSTAKGVRGTRSHIRLVSVHHLSQKEKLVLVDVPGKTLLLGVTPSGITRLSSVQLPKETLAAEEKRVFRFSEYLAHKMGSAKEKKA